MDIQKIEANLPEEVCWLAKDGNGDWFGYKNKPIFNHLGKFWDDGDSFYPISELLLKDFKADKTAKESLTKITRGKKWM